MSTEKIHGGLAFGGIINGNIALLVSRYGDSL